MITLGKDQERVKTKCESDIEELEREKQLLEVVPLCT